MSQTATTLEKLSRAVRKLSDIRAPAALYDALFTITTEVFDCPQAMVLMREEGDAFLTVVAERGRPNDLSVGRRINPGEGVKGRALATGEVQLVTRTISDVPGSGPGENNAFEAAIPIVAPSEEAMGVISMHGPGRGPEESEGALLALFGEAVSLAVSKLRLHADVEDRGRRLAVVSKLMRTAASDVPLRTLFEETLSLTNEALRPDGCSVQLCSEDRAHLTVAAARGLKSDIFNLRIPCDRGVPGMALQTRRPSLAPNMDDASAPERSPLAPDYLSELAVPLVFKDDVLGVLHLCHRRAGVFDEADLLTATILADCVAQGVGASRMMAAADNTGADLEAELTLIRNTIRDAARCRGFDEVFSEVFPLTASFLRLRRAAVLSPYAIASHLLVSHVFGQGHDAVGRQVPLERSLAGEAYRTANTVYASRAEAHDVQIWGDERLPVQAAVPMRVADEVVGVLHVETDRSLDPHDLRVLETVSGHLSALYASGIPAPSTAE